MAKPDPRVDAYISRSAPFARPILAHLRSLVREALPEVEETLKWSSPAFLLDGKTICLIAGFQKHCAFVLKGAEAVLGDAAKPGEAMGSLGRITSLGDLPSDEAMRRTLKKAAALARAGAPTMPRTPKSPSASVEIPDDLAAALKKNRAAAAFFEKLAPGYRREYVEWITAAKRAETRATRLATAIEWLADGKKRNWKYETC